MEAVIAVGRKLDGRFEADNVDAFEKGRVGIGLLVFEEYYIMDSS